MPSFSIKAKMTDTEVKQDSNGHSAPLSNSGDQKSNNKDKMSNEQLQAKIVRQVEHYFGDYNLPRDKFLKETIQSDDGWVPMDVMMKFQRLSGLSTDSKVILYNLIFFYLLIYSYLLTYTPLKNITLAISPPTRLRLNGQVLRYLLKPR